MCALIPLIKVLQKYCNVLQDLMYKNCKGILINYQRQGGNLAQYLPTSNSLHLLPLLFSLYYIYINTVIHYFT